jgi:pilus assembly protein CpaC
VHCNRRRPGGGIHLVFPLVLLLLALSTVSAHADGAAPIVTKAPVGTVVLEPGKGAVINTKRPISAISVADPELADVHIPENQNERQILLFSKKKTGATNLIVWYQKNAKESVAPYDTYEVVVSFPDDTIMRLTQALNGLPPQVCRAWVRPGGKGILLGGEVDGPETLDAVRKIVAGYVDANYTDLIVVRGMQQVQLSVRIAEVSRSDLKQMGLGFLLNRDWSIGVLPPGSGATGNITTDSGRRATDTRTGGDRLSSEISGTSSSLETGAELGSAFSSAFQLAVYSLHDNFLGILSMMKGQNLVRILASPTLVTMSGQEASFLVGGEFPVPVSGSDNQTNIDYKNYGIMLRFTPTVTAGETINLQVNPEISNIDYSTAVASGGVAVPGLKTRRASATLQLRDGQSFVMAGLLNEELASIVSKIPLLGDIPYLGTLFTSKEYQKKETELMIIVTPHLVRALNPAEVPSLPGENNMHAVSDSAFFLGNEAEPRAEAAAPGDDQLIGGGGFAR